jgi:glucose-1-phosphate thymidylyltransferase
MKLILPIAGVGQRLRPFTFSKPKGFLKIGGNRVVDHILTKISSHISPHTPLGVIYGYKRAQIRDYLEIKYAKVFDISFIDQIPKGYQGEVPYFGGLGEAILLSRAWYSSLNRLNASTQHDFTLIFLGDMVPIKDYTEVVEEMNNTEIDGIIGSMIVPAERTRLYGIIEPSSDRTILSMVEKPDQTNSNLAIAGVYAFSDSTMQRLYEILAEEYVGFRQNVKGSHREFQFTPALQQLVKEKFNLKYSTFEEGILDFGQSDSLLSGNRILLSTLQSTINGAVAEIRESIITNPCSIGMNTKLNRSVIGPYASIGENCLIEGCNLQNVVIGDNVHLDQVVTENSIIGDGVRMQKIIKNNIILGDNSIVLEER